MSSRFNGSSPSQDSRLAILQLLSADVVLGQGEGSSDGLLEEFARKTEGWSAAELRGLMVNAAFEAAEGGAGPEAPVGRAHLQHQFEQTELARQRRSAPKAFRMGERISLA